MTIGIISDTHGRIDAWKKAEKLFAGVDIIVHAGDVLYHPPRLGYTEGYDIPAMAEALNSSQTPIIIAQGNCDAPVYEELLNIPVQSPYAFAEFEGMRIMAHHGHIFDDKAIVALGKRFGVDIFVTGHTHLPILERRDGLIFLNPGSPSIPKFERNGEKIGSVAIVTEKDVRIITIEDGETLFSLDR
jgi:putative phosphoesterase